MRFEIFQGQNGQWFWRLKARNNQIVSQSEGYTRKHGALKGAFTIMFKLRNSVVPIYWDSAR